MKLGLFACLFVCVFVLFCFCDSCAFFFGTATLLLPTTVVMKPFFSLFFFCDGGAFKKKKNVRPRFQCQQLSIFGAAFFQAQSRVKVELTKIASFEKYLELKKDAVQHPKSRWKTLRK